jgi:hypothetical protein
MKYSMWDWLTGRQQKEGLARLQAIIERQRDREERQRPMHEVISRLLPMVEEAEMKGHRPEWIGLSKEDAQAVRAGVNAWAEEGFGRFVGSVEGSMLLGLPLREMQDTFVCCKASP